MTKQTALFFMALFLSAALSYEAKSNDLAGKKPVCVRPTDFSYAKLVSSYEACLERQKRYCSVHSAAKECFPLSSRGKPYYQQTQDEIEPTKRCKILKDGSYQCLQDPVRFIVTEAAPSAGAAQAPDSKGPSFTPVPVEGDVSPSTTKIPSGEQGTAPQGQTPSEGAPTQMPLSAFPRTAPGR